MSWITDQRERQGAEKVDATLTKFATNHPAYIRENACGDREFGLWLYLVDRRIGFLTHRDIADWHWRDAFDDGVSPTEAAREALSIDDTFSILFD